MVECNKIDFPCIVKPSDSNSSNGIKKVSDLEELYEFAQEAFSFSRNGKIIVEKIVSGREINVYCYASKSDVAIIATNERVCTEDGDDKSIKCFAGIMPASINENEEEKIKKIAVDIADAFQLSNTVFFFQTIIDGESINVIECAPRSGGGLSFYTIKECTGFDMIEAAIDSYLGKETKLSTYHSPVTSMVVNTIYCKSGIFDRIDGIEDMIAEGVVHKYFPYKTKGMSINGNSPSGGRVGAFVVKGKTKEEIIDKVSKIYNHIEVFDENNNSILRKDLNLTNYTDKIVMRNFK
ncbi:MAG: ATP-grasp domain-containing protein [Lachnospiraceae bacterium]|nr:ATP-grasp domain-containing protein [Lachnospiraceae bacterium]